jgi:hypothetical protein
MKYEKAATLSGNPAQIIDDKLEYINCVAQ